ncbi:hypothetical protein B0H14DRAFT_3523067 [Mycena olivaceomarginata]|nr:hypothetical protein B0H14DRAFT_3523067 [Mycena olivaceomarginata]
MGSLRDNACSAIGQESLFVGGVGAQMVVFAFVAAGRDRTRKVVWSRASGSTIPSAFGTHVPDLAKGGSQISAEMYSIWTQFIGPIRLRRAIKHIKDYNNHFNLLVQICNTCLQFSITGAQIQWLFNHTHDPLVHL